MQSEVLRGAQTICAYLKGGSAYFRIEGNELYDCREAGFQAGEGANFAFMQSPWLHHESYDIKVINNIIHDIKDVAWPETGQSMSADKY